MDKTPQQGRRIAIITGAFSIAIALFYLVLTTILDSRGPMLPPPLEALGVAVTVFVDSPEEAQPLYEWLIPRSF